MNQKRIARIESAPGVTSFDQIARLVAIMGHRLVLEQLPLPDSARGTPASPGDGTW